MRAGRVLTGLILLAMGCCIWRTWMDLRPLPASLALDGSHVRKAQFLDRHGLPLSVTFQNPWNLHEVVPLHTIPLLLQEAFVQAEDRRFYQHEGVDWAARVRALLQNLWALRVVRGASTITEQVVRMLHPRPRTPWSRWLEGIEAGRLEARFPKTAILEFYLNQVPYARQRRGVVQAARAYFNRDLDTLSPAEMLALAVLVRAPSRLDLLRGQGRIQHSVAQLARHLHEANLLTTAAYQQVLAWVSAGGSQIDAVLAPRQPGSTLKPFLYALALERGWTAATLIEDTPLALPMGIGLHTFRNYSGQHYGPLRLREALGNSLNVPAVRTIALVGDAPFLERLHQLGFHSLTQPADHYGHGLALGNGEVSLFELVQAYATLARQGVFQPSQVVLHDSAPPEPGQRVFSPEVSSLIANILADPESRHLEFGRGNLLRFPVETAVKTGTSSDYRDAWAVGFSHRYTAGVWMGNLRQRPMQDVTGSIGPALVLRALFAELNRDADTHALGLSPRLVPAMICRITGQLASQGCPGVQEWFVPVARVDWLVDGQLVGSTGRHQHQFLWPLARGIHTAQARVWQEGHPSPVATSPVEFVVK